MTTLPPRERPSVSSVFDHLAPFGEGVVVPLPVAIGALADNVVKAGLTTGLGVKDFFVGADIAGEEHAHCVAGLGFGVFHFDRGRAEHVARIPKPRFEIVCWAEPIAVIMGDNAREQLLHMGLGIGGLDQRLSPAAALSVLAVGVALLDARAVEQHNRQQVRGWLCAMDLAAKAMLHEFRQHSRMVDMGVGEDENIDASRIKGEILVVQCPDRTVPLKHSAIDENAHLTRFEKGAGSCYRASGAIEGEVSHVDILISYG